MGIINEEGLQCLNSGGDGSQESMDLVNAIVIGVAAIVPHNAMADSLMEEISLFVEENCEADILDETREIR